MKTAVILPNYNEGERILPIINKIVSLGYPVIVVDDGSRDNTAEIFTTPMPNVIYLRHLINLGKGSALKTGCQYALENGYDFFVCMDSDGQHKPEDIQRFVEAQEKTNADIVFGARTIGKGMPLMMFIGNKFLTVTINLLFKFFVQDTQSGYRAFTKHAFRKISWDSRGYAVETEMIVRAAKEKLRFTEIMIDTIYLDNYKGTTAFDGLAIFFNILKWRFL